MGKRPAMRRRLPTIAAGRRKSNAAGVTIAIASPKRTRQDEAVASADPSGSAACRAKANLGVGLFVGGRSKRGNIRHFRNRPFQESTIQVEFARNWGYKITVVV